MGESTYLKRFMNHPPAHTPALLFSPSLSLFLNLEVKPTSTPFWGKRAENRKRGPNAGGGGRRF